MVNQFGKKQDTLCWDCRNACGGCSWSSRKHVPVEGWKATPTKIKNTKESKEAYSSSFLVLKCPQFIPDKE